jgi:hypothetical protein
MVDTVLLLTQDTGSACHQSTADSRLSGKAWICRSHPGIDREVSQAVLTRRRTEVRGLGGGCSVSTLRHP